MHKRFGLPITCLLIVFSAFAYNHSVIEPRAIESSVEFNQDQLLGGTLKSVGKANVQADVTSQSNAFYEGAALSFLVLTSSWLMYVFLVNLDRNYDLNFRRKG